MIRYIAPALLAAGAACFVAAYFCGPVWAAEKDSAHGWRLLVCRDDACELRGKVLSGPTACSLDLASAANVLPSGSRVSCVKVNREAAK
ncbi:MAG: hypothetical protein U1E23_09385 [Reyranellaceae bacterium]